MFYGEQRVDTRQFFFNVRQKLKSNAPLLPLESQIADVMQWHPEYDPVLDNIEANTNADFSIEQGQSNPFLHMGMHLALREQLATDRPTGLQALYKQYCELLNDPHEAEHQIIETLGEILWEAQRNGNAPDEQRYLQLIRERLPNKFNR